MCMDGYMVEIAYSFDCGNSWTKPNLMRVAKKILYLIQVVQRKQTDK